MPPSEQIMLSVAQPNPKELLAIPQDEGMGECATTPNRLRVI